MREASAILKRSTGALFVLCTGALVLFVAPGVVPASQPVASADSKPPIRLDTLRVGGELRVRILYPGVRMHAWEYRVPEHLVVAGITSPSLAFDATIDTTDGTLMLFGETGEPDSARYETVFRPAPDHIDLESTVTNLGDDRWGEATFGLACLRCAYAPWFVDSLMTRTFAHFEGSFVPIAATRQRAGIELESPEQYQHSAHVLRAEDIGWDEEHTRKDVVDCSLIVRSSRYGGFHVAQAWEDAFNVSYNFANPNLNCIHSNPRFAGLAPGESRTVRGRIYFFWGTIDELYARFVEDFPGLGYGVPGE